MKCKIKMGDKIAPVEGPGREGTGTCPECMTPGVMLSIVGGFVRAHTVSPVEIPENNPKAATLVGAKPKYGKGLTEPQVELVDTGLRAGDPREAMQRRVVELNGVTGQGTVTVPVKGEKGRAKLTEVPATEENVRKALAHWRAKKPRSDSGRKEQNAQVSRLTRMLEAIMSAQVCRYNPGTGTLDVVGTSQDVVTAQVADRAAVHRGPTLVPGRDVAPRLRDPEQSWDEPTDLRQDGSVRKATTLDQPRGRDRFDPKITTVAEPAPKLTPSQRRRFRRAQAMKSLVARKRKDA